MKHLYLTLNILRKKVVFIPLILLFILAAFLLTRPQSNKIELTEVKIGEITQEVVASGKLASKNIIKLKPKVSGEITFLDVEVGNFVESGRVLLSLENIEQSIALKQSQNTLREKQAILEKTLDDIHLFQYGNGGFENIGSANETQTQKQLRTQAEVSKDNAYESLKLAQKRFSDTIIFSPFRGLVLSVNAPLGQVVSPQEILIELADLSEVFFDAEVDEVDSSKVKPGQMVKVSLDSYPEKEFRGVVSKILPQTRTITSGAEVIMVRIKVDPDLIGVDNPGSSFISRLSGQSRIIVSEAKNTLIIPIEALKDENTVVIQTSSGFEEKDIELGIQSETNVEVKKGLNEGDKVVLNPPSILSMAGRGIWRFLGR